MHEYRTLGISNIISGKKLEISNITNYLNYIGRSDGRKNTFVAMSLTDFESQYKKEELAERWNRLSGVAVVQCISNTHFHSVFFTPGKMREPIIGYDSRKVYSSERVDLSGEKCSQLNDKNKWTTQVNTERNQQSVELLVTFISRVAKTADEIRRMSGSALCNGGYIDRGWKILRSFVSQTDDKSCGVLACLFLECMKNDIDVNGVKEDVSTESLQEYRWEIASKCCKYRIEDYYRRGGHTGIGGNIIDLID